MSLEGLLVNSVSVYRPTTTYSKGVPTKSYSGSPIVTGMPCNIQYISAAITKQREREFGYVMAEGWYGFFLYGADIKEDDKIVGENGRSFIVKSTRLDTVGHRHHIECKLELWE